MRYCSTFSPVRKGALSSRRHGNVSVPKNAHADVKCGAARCRCFEPLGRALPIGYDEWQGRNQSVGVSGHGGEARSCSEEGRRILQRTKVHHQFLPLLFVRSWKWHWGFLSIFEQRCNQYIILIKKKSELAVWNSDYAMLRMPTYSRCYAKKRICWEVWSEISPTHQPVCRRYFTSSSESTDCGSSISIRKETVVVDSSVILVKKTKCSNVNSLVQLQLLNMLEYKMKATVSCFRRL